MVSKYQNSGYVPCSKPAEYSDHTVSLIIGPDLHFRTFERIFVTFPVIPDDALITRRVAPGYVSPIQLAAETAVEPPGTFVLLSTVTAAVGILVQGPW